MERKLQVGLLLLITLWMASCKPSVINVITEIPVLRASSIYRTDSVDNFLKVYKDKNKEMADAYFKKGKESENSNPDKSIFYIKRAITLYPTYRYYKELGTFSCTTGKYDEMHNAYHFLLSDLPDDILNDTGKTHIQGGVIDPPLIYEGLMSYILSDGGIFYNYEDEDLDNDAKEMGISMDDLRMKVFSDPRLKLDSNSEAFKDLMLNFFTRAENVSYMARPSTFHYFISTIRDTSKVFEIDKDKVWDFDYSAFNGSSYRGEGPENMLISEYFDRYLPERKKDSTWENPYNYTHLIHLNDSVLIIICAIDSSEPACPADMRQIYHRLMTMTKNGRMIATDVVAKQVGDELSILEYNYNKYTIKYFKRNWAKAYKKDDFDNDLLTIEQTGVKNFLITPTGEIKKDSVSAGNRATP